MRGLCNFAARAILTFSLATGTCSMAFACDSQMPCSVEDGEYFISLPKSWNGRDPLPAVVFFHGYSGSAEAVMADATLVAALSDDGVALIAPQGAKDARGVHTWSFPGGQTLERDDFAYVDRVRKDMAARWPIDPARTLASGFSVGGSMVWYVACRTPKLFAAYAPVAGAFWSPEPETCVAPVSLRHIHGLKDQTVPMVGRVLRGGAMRQGDVMKSFSTLKALDQCPPSPARSAQAGPLTCETWPARTCGSGQELILCLHDGEHDIEADWVRDSARWLVTLGPRLAR